MVSILPDGGNDSVTTARGTGTRSSVGAGGAMAI